MARLVGEGVARSAGRKTPKNYRAGDFIATCSIYHTAHLPAIDGASPGERGSATAGVAPCA